MIYLFESEIPENKSVLYAIQKIQGIGKSSARLICKNLGFLINLKVNNLSKEQISALVSEIESLNLILGSDLKKFKLLTLKRHLSTKSYRGLRKYQGLPVKGQRTHTNAKTARKKK